MTTHSKLESSFGKIEKSQFQANAKARQQERSWKSYAQQISLEVLDYLEGNGMSQKQLALLLGVSPQLVNKWLKGGENFTLETVCKLETVLGIKLIVINQQTKPKKYSKTEKFEFTAVYQKSNVSIEEIDVPAKVVSMPQNYSYAKTC